ncbi:MULTISPECIES: TetR/AcrR family transcriptional regulator [unclassified Streptomyces]|uniref:TetR/AcrR family transcriptional regulator n=1 Tax=unclassified Streptomyces TaxID=2593676 RepID=UPI000377F530|nr:MULTISPECIES: TetR/AcrR family transcriptional regulator [unclassified Streptomyces]MYT31938.1 TetR family transcriptional regulator [Streptomyces sp. SID8354]
MSAIQGARERARREITAAIKDEARRQLATEGAAKLSLRAVARELGMVSSALYRYFPSRDELLTALIIDAYDAVGEAAERALAEAGAAPVARWTAVCRAVRGWALAHPHEYALIYGSPVPGYAAPQDTTAAAARVGLALIGVVQDARPAGGAPAPAPAGPPPPQEVLDDVERLRKRLDVRLSTPVLAEAVAAWAELFGLVSFEVFGQFNRVVEAREAFFEHAVTRLARSVGLGDGEE